MHRVLKLFVVLALSLTVAAAQKSTPKNAGDTLSSSAPSSLPSEATVNGFLQDTWGYNPGLSWKIVSIRPSKVKELAEVTVLVSTSQGQQSTKFLVSPDGQHAVIGDIIPFGAHPFEPLRKELAQKATGPVRGPTTAPVTIVEFSDLQCPHCKDVQPLLERLLTEDPNVRLVFQNFPLPAHDWAGKAAAYAECVGRRSNDAFWKFIQGVYDSQSEIIAATADEKLSDLADKSGIPGKEIAACAAQDETVGRVQHSVALGQAVEVTGTPTLFINGRRIANVAQTPYEELKVLVDYAAKMGK